MSRVADTVRLMMTKDARKRLKYKMGELAGAPGFAGDNAKLLDVLTRRAEKGIGTYTAKVLCPHTNIVTNQFRSNGYNVYAYACADCKTRITSRIPL